MIKAIIDPRLQGTASLRDSNERSEGQKDQEDSEKARTACAVSSFNWSLIIGQRGPWG